MTKVEKVGVKVLYVESKLDFKVTETSPFRNGTKEERLIGIQAEIIFILSNVCHFYNVAVSAKVRSIPKVHWCRTR